MGGDSQGNGRKFFSVLNGSWKFIVWIITAIVAIIGWWQTVDRHVKNNSVHITPREKAKIEAFDPEKYVTYREFDDLKKSIDKMDKKIDIILQDILYQKGQRNEGR